MPYGSETWGSRESNINRLICLDRALMHLMCRHGHPDLLGVCIHCQHPNLKREQVPTPSLRNWKLYDPVVSKVFHSTHKAKVDVLGSNQTSNTTVEAWQDLKSPIVKFVCQGDNGDKTFGGETVKDKRACF